MSEPGAQWTVGGASVLGASHGRAGKPNQDAVTWVPKSGRGSRFIAAVADGHGAESHFRSEIGARLAVEAAVGVLDWAFDDPDPGALAGSLPGELVEAWRGRVGEHLAANPLQAAPRDPYVPYGATLVVAGASETLLLLCQIGDGNLLLGRPDGTVAQPLPDDQGTIGEETYSLCLPDAARHMRVQVIERADAAGWPDFVMLSTDGVAKSFADQAAFLQIGEHYRQLARNGLGATLEALPGWLGEVTRRGSGDDVSLCLAARVAGS